MAHPLLVKAADSGTVASDGGSGVLILRGATGRLLSKSAQPNKVPLASKTSKRPVFSLVAKIAKLVKRLSTSSVEKLSPISEKFAKTRAEALARS
jgi:hypothetical protein